MIRPLAALTRQAQDFFHTHLVGVYSWDEVSFAPAEKQDKPTPFRDHRGRMRRPEPPEGKFHAIVEMEFGIWRLKIEGPNEHPPLGWLTLDAGEIIEGPLDSATWKKFAAHIKEKREELNENLVRY